MTRQRVLSIFAVDMDRSSSIQRFLVVPLRQRKGHHPLQRRPRQGRPMGRCQHNRLPPLDAPFRHRPRLAPPTNRRALQRQPLHHQSGPSISHPTTTVRYARPISRRLPQQNHAAIRLFGPHGRAGSPAPDPPTRHASTPAVEYSAVSRG